MDTTPVTQALEDYLETIYLICRDHKIARVKDIAKARNVKMSSVTIAMRRLAEQGLISYSQREYIDLTEEGEQVARRVLARHDLLRRFLIEVLAMPPDDAERDACAMEHHLSDVAMDRFTRFFEYIARCPGASGDMLARFHACQAVNPEAATGADGCGSGVCLHHGLSAKASRSLADLKPGESGTVTQVVAGGAIRQRLLDMGLLPGTEAQLERVAAVGDPLWIRLQGFQLSLRRSEAESVLIA